MIGVKLGDFVCALKLASSMGMGTAQPMETTRLFH